MSVTCINKVRLHHAFGGWSRQWRCPLDMECFCPFLRLLNADLINDRPIYASHDHGIIDGSITMNTIYLDLESKCDLSLLVTSNCIQDRSFQVIGV